MAQLNLGHVVGVGVPTGGTAGQILKKNGSTNFDTSWVDSSTLPGISSAIANVAEEYDADTVYQEGDRCTHGGNFYKRKSWGGDTPAAESWTAAHWDQVTVSDELDAEATAWASAVADEAAARGTAVSNEATARANADTALTGEIAKDRAAMAVVATGDTHAAIIVDGYVYVKDHSTLAEGLYKNISGEGISANATLSTSNLAAIPSGGLNDLRIGLGSFNKIPTDTVMYTSLDQIKTALLGYFNSMSVKTITVVSVYTGNSSNFDGTVFTKSSSYSGQLYKFTATDCYGWLMNKDGDRIDFGYNNGTWSFTSNREVDKKAYGLTFGDSDTFATMSAALDTLPAQSPTAIFISTAAMSLLTDGSLTGQSFRGVVNKSGTSSSKVFDFYGGFGTGNGTGHGVSFRVNTSTGVAQYNDPSQNIMDALGNFKLLYKSCSANSSITFTKTEVTRGILVSIGGANARLGMWLFYNASSGYVKAITSDATAISVSSDGTTTTATNSANSAVNFYVLVLA